MLNAVKFIRVLFLLLMVAIFIATGCAVKKNPYATKKKSEGSMVNASQLGRNKYYFSTGYQKKLTKSYKKK